jgi:ribose-phosphate pyrophosphokinase
VKDNFRLFGLGATQDYAMKVAEHLEVELSNHVEESFSDNECYVRSDVNVRNCDVFVIQSLYQDSNETVADKFAKLLFFIGSLRDASARRITIVIPYLAYSRQDRKTESRAPITTKYVARLIEAVGADRLLTMDVHNLAALQNAFRIPTDNLEAKNLLADYVAETIDYPPDRVVVLSPDSGGMSRTKRFRNALSQRLHTDVGLAYLDKTHEGRLIRGHEIVGDVKNRAVVVFDDMISSASTISECDRAITANHGELWGACATHGLFVGRVIENLSNVRRIIITDTIARLKEGFQHKLQVISTAEMFAEAIRRIHAEGGSISDLLK